MSVKLALYRPHRWQDIGALILAVGVLGWAVGRLIRRAWAWLIQCQ